MDVTQDYQNLPEAAAFIETNIAAIIMAGVFVTWLGVVQADRQLFNLPRWDGSISSILTVPPRSWIKYKPNTIPLHVRKAMPSPSVTPTSTAVNPRDLLARTSRTTYERIIPMWMIVLLTISFVVTFFLACYLIDFVMENQELQNRIGELERDNKILKKDLKKKDQKPTTREQGTQSLVDFATDDQDLQSRIRELEGDNKALREDQKRRDQKPATREQGTQTDQAGDNDFKTSLTYEEQRGPSIIDSHSEPTAANVTLSEAQDCNSKIGKHIENMAEENSQTACELENNNRGGEPIIIKLPSQTSLGPKSTILNLISFYNSNSTTTVDFGSPRSMLRTRTPTPSDRRVAPGVDNNEGGIPYITSDNHAESPVDTQAASLPELQSPPTPTPLTTENTLNASTPLDDVALEQNNEQNVADFDEEEQATPGDGSGKKKRRRKRRPRSDEDKREQRHAEDARLAMLKEQAEPQSAPVANPQDLD